MIIIYNMDIKEQAAKAAKEIIEAARLNVGEILVVGCSSSEVSGGTIGHDSNYDIASEVFDSINSVCRKKGVFLAAQCCEHLNRAVIIEKECAEKYGYEPVCVVPKPNAGGSFATNAWEKFDSPTAVEHIRAHAGIDIGGTLIGMHLREVAVPVRLSVSKIGEANILCARTRPKYIGGERAKYE